MDRSLRFRVCPCALHALFRLAFAPAPALKALTSHARSNSPDHNAKGTPSPVGSSEDKPQAPTACMHTVSGSISLAVRRSFHLSLTVLFTIGHRFVFSLGGWSPQIQSGFLVSRPTRVPNQNRTRVSHTGLSPPMVRHSRRVPLHFPVPYVRSRNPAEALAPTVWALPLSLAATQGISFDFSSSGYLDVSVPRVGSALAVTGSSPAGFPHSDISGSMPACGSPKLFAACHVLPRRSVPRHPPCALLCLTSLLPQPLSFLSLDRTLLSSPTNQNTPHFGRST